MAAYSDALRLELAPLGVKVVTLYMGTVKTALYGGGPTFDPEGLYVDVEAAVVKRGQDNSQGSMSTEQFARDVVGAVLGKPGMGKGEDLWKGDKAGIVWFLTTWGPKSVVSGVAEGNAGLTDEVKKSIAKRGRAAAGRQK